MVQFVIISLVLKSKSYIYLLKYSLSCVMLWKIFQVFHLLWGRNNSYTPSNCYTPYFNTCWAATKNFYRNHLYLTWRDCGLFLLREGLSFCVYMNKPQTRSTLLRLQICNCLCVYRCGCVYVFLDVKALLLYTDGIERVLCSMAT